MNQKDRLLTSKKIRAGITACLLSAAGSATVAQPAYNYDKIQMEQLGRGVVAVRSAPDSVCVTWRYLREDDAEVRFDLYRNDSLVAHGLEQTLYADAYAGRSAVTYRVEANVTTAPLPPRLATGSYTLPADAPTGYLDIPLSLPANGTTPDGRTYSYSANDASIGDVDGDGEYEIILKWDPSNAHDNAHDGYTGNVLIDCYKLSGRHLWRIDLGRNIRAGAHYTQFMVYDLDGDGQAEVVMKTADGTTDGVGTIIGNATADYREKNGRIMSGPEYLTVFSGLTGKALFTTDYIPERGDLRGWGDSRANRSDRYLACVAYLDGIHPSVVMCRGYYTRTVLAAWDWDGKQLSSRWVFDTNNKPWQTYAGQGNHNLRVGDVDGDGCDEIVYGSMIVDNTGLGLNNNRTGHGDALHMTAFIPDDDRLQIWDCHENRRDGSTLRDAATGKILFQIPSGDDVGRCMAADIDPENPGVEMWSLASGGIRNYKGEVIHPRPNHLSFNMAVWWDGDLLRELLDRNVVSKYDWTRDECRPIAIFDGCTSNNGTKSTPCLQGDLVGDWREEVLLRTHDNRHLRLYVSTIPTRYRFWSFLQDPIYRISIATQNVAYNQPTQPGFYFGPDLKKGARFRGSVIQ